MSNFSTEYYIIVVYSHQTAVLKYIVELYCCMVDYLTPKTTTLCMITYDSVLLFECCIIALYICRLVWF